MLHSCTKWQSSWPFSPNFDTWTIKLDHKLTEKLWGFFLIPFLSTQSVMPLPNGFPVMEFVILGFHCFMLIFFIVLLIAPFFIFYFCGEGWGWTHFFDTSVVIIIVKAGLFEKPNLCRHSTVFSLVFIHMFTHLFQQSCAFKKQIFVAIP